MVFIGGPRQVGKTTLARQILKTKGSYFNWDNVLHRQGILKNQLPIASGQLVFDEIHKFSRWRNFIKGLYDTYGDTTKIIVTGSARLNHFKKGGDSLFGNFVKLKNCLKEGISLTLKIKQSYLLGHGLF